MNEKLDAAWLSALDDVETILSADKFMNHEGADILKLDARIRTRAQALNAIESWAKYEKVLREEIGFALRDNLVSHTVWSCTLQDLTIVDAKLHRTFRAITGTEGWSHPVVQGRVTADINHRLESIGNTVATILGYPTLEKAQG